MPRNLPIRFGGRLAMPLLVSPMIHWLRERAETLRDQLVEDGAYVLVVFGVLALLVKIGVYG